MFRDFYQNKRIFLTGHTGFKGSWLAEWLLMLGAEVHGYALDPQPHEILFHQLGLADRIATDTRADLADRSALAKALDQANPDLVLHLAAQPLVRLSYEIPIETFGTNVMGTAHLLEAVRLRNQDCSVVCVTTDKCYENREWLHAYREEDAMGGHDPYSASKGAAELVIASYRRSFFAQGTGDRGQESGIKLASARAGNVIGGGDWALDRIVPDCIRALRGEQAIPVRNKIATRPWQHVLEPLSGYLHLAASLASSSSDLRPSDSSFTSHAAGDKSAARAGARPTDLRPSTFRPSDSPSPLSSAFNFGPALTSNRTVAELVQELLKHTGGEWIDASDPHALHEASKLNLAIDKAFHLLQWQPVWNFEQTVAATAEWYQDEANGRNSHELTTQQIQAYHQAASAKGLAWATGEE